MAEKGFGPESRLGFHKSKPNKSEVYGDRAKLHYAQSENICLSFIGLGI